MAIKKYRPYLTKLAINWIYNEAASKKAESEEANLVFLEIASFAINLDASLLKESYTTKPREELITSLGETTSLLGVDTFVDPNVSKLVAYNKYTSSPEECTEDEVLVAIDYKEYVLKETLTEEERAVSNAAW